MKQVLRNSIDHRDIHDGVEKVFDIRSHTWAAPVGVNNQAIPYMLDTGAEITYKQPSLNCPSVYEGVNLGTAAN